MRLLSEAIQWLIAHLSSSSLVVFISAACGIHLICLSLYRVYFSPLAKFPGPTLAALTTWYQGYYDLWLRGQYIWKIKDLHAQYGPIVRINPHEIHIHDPEYIDELYAGGLKKRDKYRWVARMASIQESMVATVPHELHRQRRAALNPYFSKASIRRLEPMVRDSVWKLLRRMDSCYNSGEVMSMMTVYKAMTSDIINTYAFGRSDDCMNRDDYNAPFFNTVEAVFGATHLMLHCGWLGPLMKCLPVALIANVMPAMGGLYKMQQDWVSQIEDIRNSKNEKAGENTIFHGLLNSDLPESEKSSNRLMQEAQLVVVAGQGTTATTLSAITYQLLANPSKLAKLKTELAGVIPDASIPPTYAQVAYLPYLTAVIQEGIRLHPGATLRQQRVSPVDDLIYIDRATGAKWIIPAGTPISMTPTLIQTDPKYFPSPNEFRPERWIENQRLDRYLLAFSKGTRICLGINLAYQELYLVIAAIFRKYDVYDSSRPRQGLTLALYDTIRERDVDLVADIAIPGHARGSKGVRIQVV